MTSRSRRSRRQPRTPSNAASRFQLRVFAEGMRTEVQYVNHVFRSHKEQVIVRGARLVVQSLCGLGLMGRGPL
jgi:hypothetical protein